MLVLSETAPWLALVLPSHHTLVRWLVVGTVQVKVDLLQESLHLCHIGPCPFLPWALPVVPWLLMGMFVAQLALLVWLLPQHVTGYAVSP